jgi:hypothetical protein
MSSLGGGTSGISPKQTMNDSHGSSEAMTRRVLRSSWNTSYATGTVNNYGRSIGPFKAVNNIGDFLNRQNYVCNVPNATHTMCTAGRARTGKCLESCDTTSVPCSNTNTKFIPDSSSYITFKKQQAMNKVYNDSSFVGDNNNASYVAFKMHH